MSNKKGYVTLTALLSAGIMLVCFAAALNLSLSYGQNIHNYFDQIHARHSNLALIAREQQQAQGSIVIDNVFYGGGDINFSLSRPTDMVITIAGRGRISVDLRSPQNTTVFSERITNNGAWQILNLERFGFVEYVLHVSGKNLRHPISVALRE